MPLRPMIPKNSPFFHFKADIIKRFEFFIAVGSKSVHKSPAQRRDLLVGYAESFADPIDFDCIVNGASIFGFDGEVFFHFVRILNY